LDKSAQCSYALCILETWYRQYWKETPHLSVNAICRLHFAQFLCKTFQDLLNNIKPSLNKYFHSGSLLFDVCWITKLFTNYSLLWIVDDMKHIFSHTGVKYREVSRSPDRPHATHLAKWCCKLQHCIHYSKKFHLQKACTRACSQMAYVASHIYR